MIANRKRKNEDETQPTKVQRTINELSSAKNCKSASQEAVDDATINFTIFDLQPFSTTEKPAFRNLITVLAPNRTIICRKTAMTRIGDRYQNMRQQLLTLLQKQRFVATTTDCWSAHHRSYIGVAVHWINESTMK